ncbi:Transmembrane protein 56 [Zostera marina]|uniref:Transmembrane protein 56 n=1 Tax=Zostera marina TaxID=29655 RepID=A0A0K9Q5A2_ZOSMR|nr:Transmembrane protein 56 [Zostera marina]
MIFWLFPSLGGMEYVLHHFLSLVSLVYTRFSGEGQLYTYMVLISEATTPGINFRWFLDTAGMKKSTLYLMNGIMMLFSWMLVRILLFIYVFYHEYFHFDQIMKMHRFGFLLVVVVPSVLTVMNVLWFGKIIKGLRKTMNKLD